MFTKTLKTGMAAVLLMLSSQVIAQTHSDPKFSAGYKRANGNWTLSERTCYMTDGTAYPADDAFKLGRDKLSLAIRGRQLVVANRIDGLVSVDYADIDQVAQLIRSRSGVVNPYTLAQVSLSEVRLIVNSDGFGEGGSCLPGDSMILIFVRK